MARKHKAIKKKSGKVIQTEIKKKSAFFTMDALFVISMLAIIALTYFIRCNFFDMPLERDEGDYGLAGKLILEGAIPYKDVFEQKPPGLFYSYAIVESIFGTSARALHVGFMVVNMLTIVFLAYGMKFLTGPIAGIATAVGFTLLSVNPYANGFTVQAEHLLIFYVSVAFFMLAYYYRSERLSALIIAGAAVAWATTIKQNGIFFIVIMIFGVLAVHFSRKNFEWKRLAKEMGALAIGGVGIAVSVVLLMLMQGVWDEFIFWSITFPREFYISKITLEQGLTFMKGYYLRISAFNPWIWYASIAGILLFFFTKKKLSIKIWFVLLVALAYFSIWPGLRFYGHYWLQLFFGISVGLGLLAFAIEDLLLRKLNKAISFLIPVTLLLGMTIFSIDKNKQYYFDPVPEDIMARIYGDNPFTQSRSIANFINSKNPNPATDKLIVLGSEPQILLETGLHSPTPHTFMIFVASTHPASALWRKEYLEMLKKNEAKYAVFVMHPYSWLASGEVAAQFVNNCYQHMMRNYKVIGIADILSPTNTIYKWEDEAESYKPQSAKYMIVMERR